MIMIHSNLILLNKGEKEKQSGVVGELMVFYVESFSRIQNLSCKQPCSTLLFHFHLLFPRDFNPTRFLRKRKTTNVFAFLPFSLLFFSPFIYSVPKPLLTNPTWERGVETGDGSFWRWVGWQNAPFLFPIYCICNNICNEVDFASSAHSKHLRCFSLSLVSLIQ